MFLIKIKSQIKLLTFKQQTKDLIDKIQLEFCKNENLSNQDRSLAESHIESI